MTITPPFLGVFHLTNNTQANGNGNVLRNTLEKIFNDVNGFGQVVGNTPHRKVPVPILLSWVRLKVVLGNILPICQALWRQQQTDQIMVKTAHSEMPYIGS
jgi:hypothetical protein